MASLACLAEPAIRSLAISSLLRLVMISWETFVIDARTNGGRRYSLNERGVSRVRENRSGEAHDLLSVGHWLPSRGLSITFGSSVSCSSWSASTAIYFKRDRQDQKLMPWTPK